MQAFLGLEAGTAVVTLRSYVYVYAISGVNLNFGTLAGVMRMQTQHDFDQLACSSKSVASRAFSDGPLWHRSATGAHFDEAGISFTAKIVHPTRSTLDGLSLILRSGFSNKKPQIFWLSAFVSRSPPSCASASAATATRWRHRSRVGGGQRGVYVPLFSSDNELHNYNELQNARSVSHTSAHDGTASLITSRDHTFFH